jgi:collagen type III alpha
VIGLGGVGVTGGSGADGGVTLFWTMSCPGGIGGSISTVLPGSASSGNGNAAALPTGANVLAAVGGQGGISFGMVDTQLGIGGEGGASYFGAGGTGQTPNEDGLFSNSPGAGGGGNINVGTSTPLRGGNGSNGLVIIREFSA